MGLHQRWSNKIFKVLFSSHFYLSSSSSSGKHASYLFTSELNLTRLGTWPYQDGETKGEISGKLSESF